METLPEGLLLLRARGQLLLANRLARELAGWPEEALPALERAGELGRELRSVLEDLAADSSASARRARLVAARGAPLRVLGLRLGADVYAMLLREETTRDAELRRVLTAGLGLSATDARLGARIYRGFSTTEIARAYGVSENVIRVRLSRLCSRLGLGRRTELVLAIEGILGRAREEAALATAEHGRSAHHVRRPRASTRARAGRSPVHDLRLARDGLADLEAVVHRVAMGLAVLDGTGRLLCANQEGQRLLLGQVSQPADAPALPRAVAQVARQLAAAPGGHAPHSMGLRHRGTALRVVMWRAAANLVGMQVRQERLRTAEVEALLADRYGLSPRQAAVAVGIAGGKSNADVAAGLGISEGSVGALSSTVYAKLAVRGRVELAGLCADLAGGEYAPMPWEEG